MTRNGMPRGARLVGMLAFGLILAGCSNELILPGERFGVREPLEASLPEGEEAGAVTPLKIVDAAVPENEAKPITLPAAQTLSQWVQRGVNPAHRLPHLALAGTLAPRWQVSIGSGNDRKHRITADPVVDGGRIFTLDSRATVKAHTLAGAPAWSRDLRPTSDKDGDASGGGLAIGAGRLFVTSGFGTVTALDPATGEVIWSQKIGAVGSAAPVVMGDLLYVMGRDNRAWAIRTGDGKVVWEAAGTPGQSGYVGGAGPALDSRVALLPFASGELVSVLRLSGVRTWTAVVSGQRRGMAYANVSDLSADPVIDGQTVFAANSSGRMSAVDIGTGKQLWTASEGTAGQVIVAGGALFLVADDAELVRLDAATGTRVWGTPLPNYVKEKPKRRKAVVAHYGPILAGGRILVASSDGLIRFFDPVSGEETGQAALPAGAASNPIVVGGVLYIVTAKGTLVALG